MVAWFAADRLAASRGGERKHRAPWELGRLLDPIWLGVAVAPAVAWSAAGLALCRGRTSSATH